MADASDIDEAVPSNTTVNLTLGRRGAKALETFTADHACQRLALVYDVYDGRINSAPVIRSTIAGGHLSLDAESPDEARMIAKRLARR